jgi:signal transduction histidine kinase
MYNARASWRTDGTGVGREQKSGAMLDFIVNSFPRSLRGKIIAVVLATTLVALTVMAAALVAYDLVTYERTRVNDLVSLAGIIARASTPSLEFDDPKAAQENLALLRVRPNIVDAAIYTSDGRRFAGYEQSAAEAQRSLPAPLAGRIDMTPAANGYAIDDGVVLIYQRILDRNEFLGTIYIRGQYEPLVRLNDYLTIMLMVMLGSLAVAVLISIWLQRRITQPIFAVAEVARQVMAQRDFGLRARKTTDDEIGVLVDAFNEMLGEVARRAEALEDFNRALEHETHVRRAAEEALRENDRRKDEFLATLAHELRNPLAPLRNALEILRRAGADPATAARARDIMARQLQQMIRLVDDLLDVSRITTGKLAVHKEAIELQSVIRGAVETARPLIDGRGQALELCLPERPVRLQADPTRLAQVFSNLLNNASKFTPAGGRIALDATRKDDGLEVAVSDNGIGLSPETLTVIFDMFTQADYSLERAQAGLGVGLTLARRLIELHGGTLNAHSEGLGRGSRFVVRLPLPADHGQAAGAASTLPGGTSRRHRVLLVDDNVDFAASLAELLKALDHEVRVAHDAEQALGVVSQFKPDFAFLDIGLPRMNGYDLARRLREQPATADAVLVAITGWGQDRDRKRSSEAGFQHHLVKPVELSQIESIFMG